MSIRKIGETYWFYQPALITGALIGFSYIPFPPWASLFAFVPLWSFWLRAKNWRQVLIGGWLAQFVLTVIGFDWVLHTIHEFGMLPWSVSAAGFVGFCSFANLDLVIAGLVWWFLSQKLLRLEISNRNRPAHLILLALCTLFAKDYYPMIFAWNYGYPLLWMHWPVAQVAEIIGFKGLSDLIILLNGLSFIVITQWREKRTAGRAFIALGATIIFMNLAGLALKKSLPKPDAELNALVVQANIGDIDKVYAERGWGFRDYIISKYQQLTEQGFLEAKKRNMTIDFVVWPETAYPYEMDQRMWDREPIYPPAARPLINLAKSWSTQFLVGGYGYSPKDNKPTNTFYIAQSSGDIQRNPYYKTILLAFGEYIPFGDYFPKLYQWIPAGDFSRGPGPVVKVVPLVKNDHVTDFTDLKIGPIICYEGLFASFARGEANKGAEIFVNLTNDSWYGDWQEPYQHLYETLGRAVEFRRPFVRSTNSGISEVMLADGTTLNPSPIYKEWYGIYRIPYRTNPAPTFYQRFPWLLHALFMFLFAAVVFRRDNPSPKGTADEDQP